MEAVSLLHMVTGATDACPEAARLHAWQERHVALELDAAEVREMEREMKREMKRP